MTAVAAATVKMTVRACGVAAVMKVTVVAAVMVKVTAAGGPVGRPQLSRRQGGSNGDRGNRTDVLEGSYRQGERAH